MGIKTIKDYVKFYKDLEMQGSVSFLSFINNEKMVLKHKMENKNVNKDTISKGISILEKLQDEIKNTDENSVLEKYST